MEQFHMVKRLTTPTSVCT